MDLPQDDSNDTPTNPDPFDAVQALLMDTLEDEVDLQQALLVAINHNNLNDITTLLQNPAVNVNFMTAFLYSPLHCACLNPTTEALELLLDCRGVDVNCALPSNGQTPLHFAGEGGVAAVVQRLLKDPRVDVNPTCALNDTPLHLACHIGNVSAVSALLADDRVAPNPLNLPGCTPFYGACQFGQLKVVEMLLANEGVDLNVPDGDGTTALWIAAHQCHVPIIHAVLMSGRDVDLSIPSSLGHHRWQNKTPAQIARSLDFHPVCLSPSGVTRRRDFGVMIADLLDLYTADSKGARQRIMELPEQRGHFISALFALVIFLSDGLLSLQPSSSSETLQAIRFFQIARALPLELQMLLCNRVWRSPKDLILTATSEPAFKKLANPEIWTSSS